MPSVISEASGETRLCLRASGQKVRKFSNERKVDEGFQEGQLDWGPEVQKSLPKRVPTESSTVALDAGVPSAALRARAGQDVKCRGSRCGCSVEDGGIFTF